MIPISTRFFVPLLAALMLASIPVTAQYIIGYPADECADPEAMRRLSMDGTTIESVGVPGSVSPQWEIQP